jgi:hypothetical protein
MFHTEVVDLSKINFLRYEYIFRTMSRFWGTSEILILVM